MTMQKMVNGELVDLTPEEEAAHAAEAAEARLTKWPAKKAEISHWRDEALDGGVTFSGYTIDSDARSRANLAGIVASVSAGIPLPDGFTWRSADNQNVPMTGQQLIALGGAMLLHVNTCYVRSWELKAAVDAIDPSSPTSDADLAAVVW